MCCSYPRCTQVRLLSERDYKQTTMYLPKPRTCHHNQVQGSSTTHKHGCHAVLTRIKLESSQWIWFAVGE